MFKFIVRRLLLLVPILLGLSFLVFIWIRALPGGPAEALLGERATPEAIAQIERDYGLNKPIHVQYWEYVKTTASGDLGTSVTTRRPVTDELKQRFPATIELAIAAMLFSLLGIPLGFFAAKHYGRAIDSASLFVSLLGVSIPIFFLAILLKYVFAVQLGWLPTTGRVDARIDFDHPTNFYLIDSLWTGDFAIFWDVVKHLILPAIALGSIPLAIIARITRAAVLDVQNEDYVRVARAKGLSPREVDSRHVLRNALLPIITIIGLQTGLLLSGAVLTETVFAWPGMGTWLVDAIRSRNYPVLAGRDPVHRGHLRPRQPGRRHHLRPHQPEDPRLVSVAEIEAPRSRPRGAAERALVARPGGGCVTNPGADRRVLHGGDVRLRRALRAVDRPLRPAASGPLASQRRLLPGAVRRASLRSRPARPRPVLAGRVRRSLLAPDRGRLGRRRPLDRAAHRRGRGLCRAAGSTRC